MLDSQNPNIYYNRGVIYIQLKNYPLAIADYDQAIQLDPNNALYYSNRGIARYRNNQLDQALADYDLAIKLDPKYVLNYQSRANAYAQKNQTDLAIQDYTMVIELDPEYSEAYYNRGVLYYQLKKFDLALADFNTIIEKEMPNMAQAFNMRAIIGIVRQEYTPALHDLTSAIEHNPQIASSYYRRALVYKWFGNRSEAVADLKQYIQLETDPNLLKQAEELLHELDS
jgi:tetratricopeptide (TPR) repeat protein